MAAIALSCVVVVLTGSVLLSGRTITASWVRSRFCCAPAEGLVIAALWQGARGVGFHVAPGPPRLRLFLLWFQLVFILERATRGVR